VPLPIAGRGHEAAATRDFVWFVYGSSLDHEAFATWAAEHGYALPSMRGARRARLPGFGLVFDVASRSWGGAVASLAEATGDVVEGLAVPMPGAARGLVEHREGAVSGLYTAIEVVLQDVETGAAIPAIAFRASASRRLHGYAPPAPAYIETVIRGARASGLSEEWIHRLEALRSSASATGHP
jgi:gamma-glutamylcyclotransferase